MPGQPPSAPTVLVVDDDESIRKLLLRVLTGAGYQVLEASNGAQALIVSREHQDRIDLLVTDVVMPEMDGFVLGEILEALRPATPVLYVTGNGAVTDTLRKTRATAHWSFLLKPFTAKTFLDRVRQIRGVAHPRAEKSAKIK